MYVGLMTIVEEPKPIIVPKNMFLGRIQLRKIKYLCYAVELVLLRLSRIVNTSIILNSELLLIT